MSSSCVPRPILWIIKGVAEKAVDATNAEWSVTLKSRGEDFASALANLRREKPALEGFLAQYGFKAEALSYGAEDVQVHYETITNEQGREQSVPRGYDASMTVFVKTEDLQKVQEARDKIIDYQAQGHALDVGEVRFMVGNLSDIKLALIGEATKDAKIRADEFAKNGNAQVGTMRSASQGTFDILAADGDTITKAKVTLITDTVVANIMAKAAKELVSGRFLVLRA